MALVKSDYTKIKTVDLGNTDYQMFIKINSYKDGSLEATITDSLNTIHMDIDLVDTTTKFFKQYIHIPIKKLLTHNGVNSNGELMYQITKEIKQIMSDVKNFNGRPTLDYDIHECHGMVIVKENK